MSAFEPYEGNDPYIFISYGRKDKDRVFSLLDALHDKGYRIWRDEGGIPWGVRWMRTIEEHITRAEVCLVFWSEASAASQYCEAETAEMIAEQKTIVTVFLDDTPVTPGPRMYLRRFQSVKLSDFDSDAAFIERLAREQVFSPCKAAPAPPIPWNKDGLIQWYLDEQGVLTIAKNDNLSSGGPVSMPNYTWDERNDDLSLVPWMSVQEKICSIVIRDDIDIIGNRAFGNCTHLTSITIPNSVTSIGRGAFYNCKGLTNVTIPDGVTIIGDRAFWGCSLTNVTIPDSVTSIGDEAFLGCQGLTTIHVDGTNRAYSSRDGVLFDRKGTILVQYPISRVGETYVIPDSVTSIGDFAFVGCTVLTSVTIGNSVTTIGTGAFSQCVGLTSVTISDSVTKIGRQAFFSCASLTSVIIPDSVTTIGEIAFARCAALTSVSIPDSVTFIGTGAFADCKGLKSVTIPAGVELGYEAFPDDVQIIRRPPRGEGS